jgi:hypothetical protein
VSAAFSSHCDALLAVLANNGGVVRSPYAKLVFVLIRSSHFLLHCIQLFVSAKFNFSIRVIIDAIVSS